MSIIIKGIGRGSMRLKTRRIWVLRDCGGVMGLSVGVERYEGASEQESHGIGTIDVLDYDVLRAFPLAHFLCQFI
jgi:hypothetical protein